MRETALKMVTKLCHIDVCLDLNDPRWLAQSLCSSTANNASPQGCNVYICLWTFIEWRRRRGIDIDRTGDTTRSSRALLLVSVLLFCLLRDFGGGLGSSRLLSYCRPGVGLMGSDPGRFRLNPLVPFVLHASEPEINPLHRGLEVHFEHSSFGVVILGLSYDIEFGARLEFLKRNLVEFDRGVSHIPVVLRCVAIVVARIPLVVLAVKFFGK
mmetsp:Transcript_26629/g.76868  ORF Transcript_26629/g.76868 Transcript_26629/m.76868 type:complete len:212 (-) Transcript_26629:5814-6449(-)